MTAVTSSLGISFKDRARVTLAGAALQGMMPRLLQRPLNQEIPDSEIASVAKLAWRIADSMIANAPTPPRNGQP
jgi:hypothetical protein